MASHCRSGEYVWCPPSCVLWAHVSAFWEEAHGLTSQGFYRTLLGRGTPALSILN